MDTALLRAHDLVWCDAADALDPGASGWPSWAATGWHPGLPVVVRRAPRQDGCLPVGLRGPARHQRHPAHVDPARIVRCVTPQTIAAARAWRDHPHLAQRPPLMALIALAPRLDDWGLDWGITGATGFELATGTPVLHPDSDLDLTLRCPEPPAPPCARRWQAALDTAPCRVDVQLETPHGAVALTEWLRGGRCLLKTPAGPCLVSDPWQAAPALEGCA